MKTGKTVDKTTTFPIFQYDVPWKTPAYQ